MQNARRAHKIRLCGHLRRYKKIVKKTYIIYNKYTQLYSFDVSQDTYENNEVEKSMRICKRKSVFQFEYWVLHE